MTQIEVSENQIYLSTTDRSELLELIGWITLNFNRMESRNQKQITILDFRKPDEPRLTDEPPNHGEGDVE